MVETTRLTAVLMVRTPGAGPVKTRLTTTGRFDGDQATEIALAMVACIGARLAARGPLVIAATPDATAAGLAARLGVRAAKILDQGEGDLGQRLERIWSALPAGPVAFFGGDSPDVPDALLDEISAALADGAAAVGPTPDGGYWAIAAPRCEPALFAEIDWGSANVYDQTCRRARAAGVPIRSLTEWPDVDRPEDLDALRERLRSSTRGEGDKRDPLSRLAERLAAVEDDPHDRHDQPRA